jgi:hypothetical protein
MMRRHIFLAGMLVGIAVSVPRSLAAGLPYLDDQKLSVRLGQEPDLKLRPRPPLTDAQARHLKDLISALAAVDDPNLGSSDMFRWDGFGPLCDEDRIEGVRISIDRYMENSPLEELVAAGPDALPFLLDALDDQRPTKLVINQVAIGGGAPFPADLPTNPVNPFEKAVHIEHPRNPMVDNGARSYTVKIGDICFVAIGRIVGRRYVAFGYFPLTGSTSSDPKLCAEVRAIWKSPEPWQRLLDSLCADYSTVGIFNGRTLDGWDEGNDFQCRAALRMLFYYPRETAALLARRLDGLDVGSDADLEAFKRRCVANHVRSDEFIEAVAWSSDPNILGALTGVFRRTGDVDSLLTALPGVDDKELIRKRLEEQVIALPADDAGPFGRGFYILRALLHRVPEAARAEFDRYLENRSADRCHTVCVALRGEKITWDVDVLLPMLSDTRTFGWNYAVVAGQNWPRLPIRICDEAGVTINQNHPALKFTQAGDYADLDRQVAALRVALLARGK